MSNVTLDDLTEQCVFKSLAGGDFEGQLFYVVKKTAASPSQKWPYLAGYLLVAYGSDKTPAGCIPEDGGLDVFSLKELDIDAGSIRPYDPFRDPDFEPLRG